MSNFRRGLADESSLPPPPPSGVPVSVPFSNQASITVTHNLGRYVLVQTFDASGAQIEAQVVQSLNSFVVSFGSPETGTIIYI